MSCGSVVGQRQTTAIVINLGMPITDLKVQVSDTTMFNSEQMPVTKNK